MSYFSSKYLNLLQASHISKPRSKFLTWNIHIVICFTSYLISKISVKNKHSPLQNGSRMIRYRLPEIQSAKMTYNVICGLCFLAIIFREYILGHVIYHCRNK